MRTTHRRGRRAALAIVMIVAGLGGLALGTTPARADVDTAQAGAVGASIEVAGIDILPATPIVGLNANEFTPPGDLGPIEEITLDINLPALLRVPVLRAVVQAGNLTGDDHSGFAAALAEVTNPSVGLDAITADALAVSCISNGDGSTSDVTVANLRIGPNTLLSGPIAPNTVIEVPGVLRVVLHEQIVVDGPGSAGVTARAAHIQLLQAPLGAVADIILGEVTCAVQGPDVLSTTAPPTTAPPSTTSTTTGPPPSTTSTTTGPPPSTSTTVCTCPTSTTTITAPPPITQPDDDDDDDDDGDNGDNGDNGDKFKKGELSRTGANVQPLAVLSGVSVVIGILMLVGTGRPLRANVTGGPSSAANYGYSGVADPERWGPVEIVKTIGAAGAALMVSIGRRFRGRRRS